MPLNRQLSWLEINDPALAFIQIRVVGIEADALTESQIASQGQILTSFFPESQPVLVSAGVFLTWNLCDRRVSWLQSSGGELNFPICPTPASAMKSIMDYPSSPGFNPYN